MLDKEKIEELFGLLERMTVEDKSKVNSNSDILVISLVFLIGMAVTSVLFFGGVFVCVFVIASIIFTFIFAGFECFLVCKNFHERALDSIKTSLSVSRDIFDKICFFEIPVIEYVLTQYRHHFQIFDKQLSAFLVVYGILMTAVFFAFQDEVKSIGVFLMVFVFVSAAFFLVLVKRRKRPDQIIALLECAIRLKNILEKRDYCFAND